MRNLSTGSPHTHKPARALAKLVGLAAVALGALFLCLHWIDDDTLTVLKHSLTGGTIIMLVIIINLISFVLFLLAYVAWQWVRRDLKPPRAEEIYSESDRS